MAKVEKYKRHVSSLLSFGLLGMGWSLTTVHGFFFPKVVLPPFICFIILRCVMC